ncbi:hypothetical protein FM120_03735 [Sphingobacterium faecium PCAi_F2.5]|nr:hypothetical protein FM120_03735 [Sphingobacterium faecium PCAi_F2.5]
MFGNSSLNLSTQDSFFGNNGSIDQQGVTCLEIGIQVC